MKCFPVTRSIVSGALIMGLVASTISLLSTADASPWDDATNKETKERFIPVELWTGAEWNGRRELEMAKVDGNYRHIKLRTPSKGRRSGNTQRPAKPMLSTRESILRRAVLNGSFLSLTKIAPVSVGFTMAGRIKTLEPLPEVSSFPSACGKKAKRKSMSTGSMRDPEILKGWNRSLSSRSTSRWAMTRIVWNSTGA